MALDLTAINVFGQGHWNETCSGFLHAAVACSKQKSTFEDTQGKCKDVGLAFEPVVFEMQGGVEPQCAAILDRIAASVAYVDEADPNIIKSNLLERVAIIIARGSANTIKKWEAPRISCRHPDASRRLLAEAAALEHASPYFAAG